MDSLDDHDSVVDTYEAIKSRNAEAYKLLFDIEVLLREVVQHRLLTAYGQRWLRQGVPGDVQEKVRAGISNDKRVSWSKQVLHSPLYYIDFPDLKKIIVNGTNWPSAFSEIFFPKSTTDNALSEIEIVRNKIAHNRIASKDDLAVLKASWVKLIRSVSTSEISDAKRAICKRILLKVTLDEFYAHILSALKLMKSGHRLTSKITDSFLTVNEWWFDEIYFGADLENVIRLVELCNLYQAIPGGLGQAIVRRNWAFDNDIFSLFDKVFAVFDSILKESNRYYD